MADFYRDLAKILRANGFVLVRGGKGSHEIWLNRSTNRQVTVPRTTKSVIQPMKS
ncbi:MAG: type II toxin-antitoxin system HicA family toxin [Alphaproteobacteria bacterium]